MCLKRGEKHPNSTYKGFSWPLGSNPGPFQMLDHHGVPSKITKSSEEDLVIWHLWTCLQIQTVYLWKCIVKCLFAVQMIAVSFQTCSLYILLNISSIQPAPEAAYRQKKNLKPIQSPLKQREQLHDFSSLVTFTGKTEGKHLFVWPFLPNRCAGGKHSSGAAEQCESERRGG